MDKIKVGLLLSILICLSIFFNCFDSTMSIIFILGLYELIKHIINNKNKLIIIVGIIIVIASNEFISQNIILVDETIIVGIIIVISDCFQEYSGKFYGKNKIGWISPNKTIEGYIGGYIGILCYYFLTNCNFFYISSIYLLGISGDLFFSYIKRLLTIKDYSNLLLSHGGILDRFDALIFALCGIGLYKKCCEIKNS